MIGTVELSIDDYNSLINDSPKFVDKLQRKVHIERILNTN